VEKRRNIAKQHTYTSDQEQLNFFTRETRKKLKQDKNNWMEQQCEETEDAFKMHRMEEL